MSERKMRWVVRIGVLALRVLGSTWRIRWRRLPETDGVRAEHRVIYALWHGELLPLLWAHRGRRVAIVISEHKDGEIIARIAHALGFATVRGSTTRGGGRALIGLIRMIGAGYDAAVTPDGPRGPAQVFAPGAAIAAQRSGAWILPVRAVCTSSWRLKSWDRFMIPKPFARLEVSYGVATPVNASSPREAAEQAPMLTELLNAAGR